MLILVVISVSDGDVFSRTLVAVEVSTAVDEIDVVCCSPSDVSPTTALDVGNTL